MITIAPTGTGEKPLLRFFPVINEIAINDQATVEVWIDSIQALKGFSIQFSYNNEKVRILRVQEGAMFTSPVFFASFIDSAAGIVKVESVMLGSGRKADGSGTLFSFDVYGKSEGTDTLSFVSVNFRDVDLVRVEVDVEYGILTIGEPSSVKFLDVNDNSYRLFQNYPNPFNPVTNIYFYLPQKSTVSISVYNSVGQLVQKPVSGKIYQPGYYIHEYNATGLSSGVYIYRMEAKSSVEMSVFIDSKRMILVR